MRKRIKYTHHRKTSFSFFDWRAFFFKRIAGIWETLLLLVKWYDNVIEETCGFVVCDFLSKVTILSSVLIRVVAEVEIHLSHELIWPRDERVKWQCQWWLSRSGLVVIRFVQVEIWFVFAFNLSSIFKASSRSAWLSDYKVWKSSFVGFFWHISSDKVRQSNFITKCDRLLLESSPDITKCDKLFPAGNYIFNVNKRNTRTRCEMCSKLKATLYVLVSLLLNLNIFLVLVFLLLTLNM